MNQVIHAKTFFQNCISLEDPLHAPWEIACNGFLPLYLRVLTKLWSAPTFWTFDGQLPLKSVDDHIGTWSVTPKDTSDTKETQIFCTVTEGSLSLCVYFWGAPGSLQRTPSWTYPTQPCSAHAPGGAHGSICHRRPLWNTLETSSDENIHWEKSQSDSFYEENSSKSTGVTWVLPASSGVLWWLVTWSQCNQYVKEAGTSTFLSPQLSSNSSKSCNTMILDDYGMVRDGFTVFYSVLMCFIHFFQNA